MHFIFLALRLGAGMDPTLVVSRQSVLVNSVASAPSPFVSSQMMFRPCQAMSQEATVAPASFGQGSVVWSNGLNGETSANLPHIFGHGGVPRASANMESDSRGRLPASAVIYAASRPNTPRMPQAYLNSAGMMGDVACVGPSQDMAQQQPIPVYLWHQLVPFLPAGYTGQEPRDRNESKYHLLKVESNIQFNLNKYFI